MFGDSYDYILSEDKYMRKFMECGFNNYDLCRSVTVMRSYMLKKLSGIPPLRNPYHRERNWNGSLENRFSFEGR